MLHVAVYRVWDLESGRQLCSLKGHKGRGIWRCLLHPNQVSPALSPTALHFVRAVFSIWFAMRILLTDIELKALVFCYPGACELPNHKI